MARAPKSPPKNRNAAVVDIETAVRELVAELLQSDLGWHAVVSLSNDHSALDECAKLQPVLVVCELSGHEADVADHIRGFKRECPGSRIVVFTGVQSGEVIRGAWAERPHAIVHKRESLLTLREALRVVDAGAMYLSPLASRMIDCSGQTDPELSPREKIVLRLIAEGLPTKAIARELSLSPKTIEHYRSALMRKLGLHDVASLTRFAARTGLVSIASFALE